MERIITLSLEEHEKLLTQISNLQIDLQKKTEEAGDLKRLTNVYESSVNFSKSMSKSKEDAEKKRKQKSDFNSMKGELKMTTEKNERYKLRVAELEKELDVNYISKITFEEKLLDINRLNTVNDRLTTALERINVINDRITLDNQNLIGENRTLINTHSNIYKASVEKDGLLNELKEEKFSLLGFITEKDLKINELFRYAEQLDNLKTKVSLLKDENVVLENTFNNIDVKKSDHIDNLLTDVKIYKDENDIQLDKIISLKKELSQLKKGFQSLQEELIENNIKMEEFEDIVQPNIEKIKQLLFEIENLNNTIKEKDNEISQISTKRKWF